MSNRESLPPNSNPDRNDDYIDPKEAKRARKMFEEDSGADLKEGDEAMGISELNQPQTLQERLAEISKHPQHIPIKNEELGILKSTREVVLPVYLYDRELSLGEKVILYDDNMDEHAAEFVNVEKVVNKKEHTFLIKVRLPKPQ